MAEPAQGGRVRPRRGERQGARLPPRRGGLHGLADQRARRNRATSSPTTTIPADQRARVKLVGIAGGQASTLFQDQDDANSQSIMLFTPALTDKLLACCSNDMLSALTLQGGNRYLAAVETEVRQRAAQGLPVRVRAVRDRLEARRRDSAPGGHCARRLRRDRRDRRPPHRGPGDQPTRPPPRRRTSTSSGPWAPTRPMMPLRRPPRHARRRGGGLAARRRRGGRALPARRRSGRCAHSCPWRCTPTGLSSASAWPAWCSCSGAIAVVASVRSLPTRARAQRPVSSSRVTTAAHPGWPATRRGDRCPLRARSRGRDGPPSRCARPSSAPSSP